MYVVTVASSYFVQSQIQSLRRDGVSWISGDDIRVASVLK